MGRLSEGHRCDDVVGHVVHLSLSGIDDEATRERLQSIPTGLTVPDVDVDALIAAGEVAIKTSPEVAEVINALEAGSVAHPGAIALAGADLQRNSRATTEHSG